MQDDEKVTAWFAKADPHDGALPALRKLLRGAGLDEVFKWRSPCYLHNGANIATIWSFKDRAAVGFFKGTLLQDPGGLLQAPGENSRAMRVLNFADAAQVAAQAEAIRGFVAQALEVEAAGLKVDFSAGETPMPDEMVQALEGDAELAGAWAALTPGRRRGWLLQIGQAKQAATRLARIDRARAAILAGKGPQDR